MVVLLRASTTFRKKEEIGFETKAKGGDGAAVTCDGGLFHRRADVTGNALSPTVDSRVRRVATDIEEAERYRCLASIYAGHHSSSDTCRYFGTRPC